MLLIVAAILVDDLAAPSRVLAARRTGPPALAGGWELPGGKVEPGEEPVAALHRELAEELGIRVRLGAELAGPWPISESVRMRTWFGVVTAGRPTLSPAHDRLRWLGRDELTSVDWLAPDLPIVELLRGRLAGVRTAGSGR